MSSPVSAATPACWFHQTVAAVARCEGACGQPFCPECSVAPICPNCGGRLGALSIEPELVPTRVEEEAAWNPVTLLGYPLKSGGPLILAAYAILQFFASLVPVTGPIVALVIATLVPWYLFEVIRSTARGEVELPDWPDTVASSIVGSCLLAWAILAVGTLPGLGLAAASGRGFWDLWGPDALVLLLLSGLLGCLFWIPAFGAAAVYDSPLLAFYSVRHLRALAVWKEKVLLGAGLIVGILAGRVVFSALLVGLPLVGTLAVAAFSFYALILAARVVGLLFLDHEDAMDDIYIYGTDRPPSSR